MIKIINFSDMDIDEKESKLREIDEMISARVWQILNITSTVETKKISNGNKTLVTHHYHFHRVTPIY